MRRENRPHIRILAVSKYLHTMLRIADPERSRVFYEVLGMEFRRKLPIVRDGELEATNYFFGFPGQEEELELTFNHDGRGYELGTGYGHIAIGVADLAARDSLGDGLPAAPLRVGLVEGGSLDVGADDGALLVDRELGPVAN